VKPIYWAVKLTAQSKEHLLNKISQRHSKIYGEHMTLVFNPTDEQNAQLEKEIGRIVKMKVITAASDSKGQAVGVLSDLKRLDNEQAHITISCADEVEPVYSNELMKKTRGTLNCISPFDLEGVVSKFTKAGWVSE
jgi:hypothetical protein